MNPSIKHKKPDDVKLKNSLFINIMILGISSAVLGLGALLDYNLVSYIAGALATVSGIGTMCYGIALATHIESNHLKRKTVDKVVANSFDKKQTKQVTNKINYVKTTNLVNIEQEPEM